MDRLKLLHQYHEQDPDDPFTRFAIASEYLKEGEMERALVFLEALRDERPSYIGTYYHLGKLYERLRRGEDAQKTYRTGIQEAVHQSDLHSKAELEEALDAAIEEAGMEGPDT